MKHASLFSGIGGFDLAAEWAGWTNLFNCEIDPFCQRVLKYHFPDAEQYTDIRNTDFTIWRGRVDVLTGGFPCQPFSLAGKRKGTDDERHLWPEMLRAIREISPRWVVGENVLGIVNWSDGLVFEQVCADLENEGYEVQPYILPACGVDAPHQRYRTWFVAHRTDSGFEDVQRGREDSVFPSRTTSDTKSSRHRGRCNEQCTNGEREFLSEKQERREMGSEIKGCSGEWNVAATYDEGLQGFEDIRRLAESGQITNEQLARLLCPNWQEFPTQSPVCGRDDGFSLRLGGITFSKWRQESIKAYGNAIVPQVVYQIFQTINDYSNH